MRRVSYLSRGRMIPGSRTEPEAPITCRFLPIFVGLTERPAAAQPTDKYGRCFLGTSKVPTVTESLDKLIWKAVGMWESGDLAILL